LPGTADALPGTADAPADGTCAGGVAGTDGGAGLGVASSAVPRPAAQGEPAR
jgi:hypothetical protein